MPATPTKSKNLTWLIGVLAFDVIFLVLASSQGSLADLTSAKGLGLRASLVTLLPVPALLLSSLLPSNLKATLVFWRWNNPLPGARAFSVHAAADPRIALDRLRKNIGEFPQDAHEQNSRWYALYREVQGESAVVDSHKNYLLFRDLASLSLLLLLALPPSLYALGHAEGFTWAVSSLFAAQYLLCALAGRVAGIRLVQNVLAIHASLKVPVRPRAKKAAEL